MISHVFGFLGAAFFTAGLASIVLSVQKGRPYFVRIIDAKKHNDVWIYFTFGRSHGDVIMKWKMLKTLHKYNRSISKNKPWKPKTWNHVRTVAELSDPLLQYKINTYPSKGADFYLFTVSGEWFKPNTWKISVSGISWLSNMPRWTFYRQVVHHLIILEDRDLVMGWGLLILSGVCLPFFLLF